VAHVGIEVEFEQGGKKVRRPISEFLTSREHKDGRVPDSWIFAGSFFYKDEDKNIYAADTSGAVIGLFPAGGPVLQLGEKSGVPYRGEDQGMQVNAETALPVGTKVRLIFARKSGF